MFTVKKLRELSSSIAPSELHKACAWSADEIEKLRSAIKQTLDENGHLADGDNCTLIILKKAINYE